MRGVFFLKIILPAILVIVLFVISFSMIFLPMVERGFLDRKKEMITELTNSVWSVIDEYYHEVERGNLAREIAQEMALNKVRSIRYGDEAKDYFWITNMEAVMLMHPYRPELNGTNVSGYEDPQGTRLFAEAVEKVKDSGDGYIDYWWQWKDDSTRIVPKLSYVKGFEPWGWIVATGIYLEDVKDEIKAIRGTIVRTTLLFVILISIIIFYIARQSLIIERRRIDAEEELKQSQLKYKMLVEASTESTMMWLEGRLTYYNQPILNQTGYTEQELLDRSMDDLFVVQNGSLSDITKTIDQSRNIEAMLITRRGREIGVVLTISSVDIGERRGYIFIIKEVTRQLIRDKSTQMLQEELRTSILQMNAPLRSFVRAHETIDMDSQVQEAAERMVKKRTEWLFVTKNNKDIVGVLGHDVFLKEAQAEHAHQKPKVFQVMKSPVIHVKESLMLFEALLIMEREQTDYLLVRNQESQTIGFVAKMDLLEAQQNVSLHLIKKIEHAELITQLQSLYDKLPGILSVLLSADSHYQNIVQISVAVSDAITKRVIELAIERLGPPPVGFAFIALGSDGREEQTLKTDQDNAIIYSGTAHAAVSDYFLSLGGMINKWLNDIGYEFCKGKVMAGNPKWCQPVSKWKEYFREWVENSNPENILDTSIFFDLRFVYGDQALVQELKEEIALASDAQTVFFTNLAKSVHRMKVVTFSEKQETLDLKKALFPVVGFARLYALKNNIKETNTIYRLEHIIASKKMNKSFVEELLHAYKYLMFLRFRLQITYILSNKSPDNLVRLDELGNLEKATLKAAFSQISDLYTQLGFDFEGSL